MAAGDKYLAAKHSFYGTAYELRDTLSRLLSGENPDGTTYTPPLLAGYTAPTTLSNLAVLRKTADKSIKS